MQRGTNRSDTVKSGPQCACFTIRKTARVITQLYDNALRPTGLRVTQFSILMATRGLEPLTLTRLANLMAMDRTTLTRNLRPLERGGLLTIAPGQDRRERQIAITARGQQLLAKAVPLWQQVQARVVEGFGADRLQQLFHELSDLRAIGRAG